MFYIKQILLFLNLNLVIFTKILKKENMMDWHKKDTQECFQILDSNEKGLRQDEVEARLEKYGHNKLTEGKSVSKIGIFFAQLKNPIIYVILFTAIITFIFQKYTDTIVIGIVVFFNTIIGFIQEYKAETSLEALKSMVSQKCTVLRQSTDEENNSEITVDAELIVPGDIIILESGDKIPADARIIESVNLQVDESMLTGESLAVKKLSRSLDGETTIGDRINMGYAGTIVIQGRGKAIVVETGMNTEIGKIAGLIQKTDNKTSPIRTKVLNLVKILLLVALFSSFFTFLIGFFQGIAIYEMFFFAVASAISAIPEGLPVIITITLAIGVNRMAKRNAIIRELQAVDTLGASTIICSDKTGTLTTNQMTARQIYIDNKFIEITGKGHNLNGKFLFNNKEIEIDRTNSLHHLLYNATLCNNARLKLDKNNVHLKKINNRNIIDEPKPVDNQINIGIDRNEIAGNEIDPNAGINNEKVASISGDPTEGALLVLAAKKNIFKEEIEKKLPRVDEIPFNSTQKYMVTFHKKSSEKVDVYMKGAPEIVLEFCSNIYLNGEVINLSDDKKVEIIQDQLLRLMVSARSTLRNLAFAYQRINYEDIEKFKETIENREELFNFIGLVGMIDPPRTGVKKSIDLCKRAGIKVIMATGDHRITAEAIGREIGIHKDDNFIITGDKLKSLNKEELDEKIENTSIFARVSPEDKFEIVSSLKRNNHVVCMTGDGVNDAPALKMGDIGISMGKAGTDVAKESSDMILADDDFSSIVNAVEEGRVVFQNLRKVIKYLICTNIGEDAVIFCSLLLFPLLFEEIFLIFTPIQIIWVNLVTDGVLDITLAMEGKESDVMSMPPRKPDESLFDKQIFVNIIFIGTLMMVGTLTMFIYGMHTYDSRIKAQTIAFTTMALFQVFNALNCRSRTKSFFELGIFTNKYLIGAILVSIFFQFSVVHLFFFNTLLGTTPLLIIDWALIFAVSSTVFIGDEIRKLILKYKNK
ncbi:MAG: HAD-IC family P-type ATPase [Candidatus Lokiarchaeota archaeon]|nr:HAD-IC family P-type ATPase [Candidatus Lokiarchaeota archaeon]